MIIRPLIKNTLHSTYPIHRNAFHTSSVLPEHALYSRDYYGILGIQRNASTDDIKHAYRKLALKYHPDMQTNDNNSSQHTTTKFTEITAAYNVLMNSGKKSIYDTLNYSPDWSIYHPTYEWHSSPRNLEHHKHMTKRSRMFAHSTKYRTLQSDHIIGKPSLFWRRSTL